MFTPKHGSVDWSPDNSLKSLQHLRQLITLKQTEKFFIFAVITERVIEGPWEREKWDGGAVESLNEKAFFAKRWAEPDTKSSASPQPLTPHGIWQACALACHCPCIKPSNTTCQFFAICVKKKKGKKKKKPARRRQRQLTLNNPIRSLTADISYRGPAFKHHAEQ